MHGQQPEQAHASAEATAAAPEANDQIHDRPQLWVGSWLDYNNGILHGQWIDAARTSEDLWTDIRAMLAASPTARRHGEIAEEWGIFDHEHFGPLHVGEQADVGYLTAVARGIAEHGAAFAAWADHVGDDRERLDKFEDAFLGTYDSLTAYVEQLIDDLGYQELIDAALPDSLRPYVRFNAKALAHDMRLSGEIVAEPAPNGSVWIFDAR
jgi:antirestriction protein